MTKRMISVGLLIVLAGVACRANAQTPEGPQGHDPAWGVLSDLVGRKFVWNSGRARGSDASELSFHEFHWQGPELAQTQCSYWPLRNLKALCGTYLIEKQPDGTFVLTLNGNKPRFKGALAADGSIEFVNKTLLGRFVTAFIAKPDGSVALLYRNAVDGERQAPLIPVDAVREAQIMADMQSIYDAAQAQRREEAERRFDAFQGAMGAMNAVLSSSLEVAQASEARSRAALDQTMDQAAAMTRAQAQRSPAVTAPTGPAAGSDSDTAAGPGAPLRFVLSIGLQPRSGDSVNPTCYSTVVTRPGPPGWGQRGSLPPSVVGSARSTVQGFKARFISACRAASGREVTSDGNFEWVWNETADGEMRIDNARARFKEDVTVNVN